MIINGARVHGGRQVGKRVESNRGSLERACEMLERKADLKATPRDHLQSAGRVFITLYLLRSLHSVTAAFVLHC